MAVTLPKTEELQYPVQYRWDLERFERAIDTGVFDEDERIELIGGELVESMSPQHDPHADVVTFVHEALFQIFTPEFSVRNQVPLVLSSASRPEPDIAVVLGSSRANAGKKYKKAVLVVEVSDSTLRFDRTTKAGLYASAGIPEYWIVNLGERVVEVHRSPAPAADSPFGYRYESVVQVPEAQAVSPLAMPGKSIVVRDILP